MIVLFAVSISVWNLKLSETFWPLNNPNLLKRQNMFVFCHSFWFDKKFLLDWIILTFFFERGVFIYLDKNCLFLNEWKDGHAKRTRLSLLSSLLTKLISFEIEKIKWELKKILLNFVNQMKNIGFFAIIYIWENFYIQCDS